MQNAEPLDATARARLLAVEMLLAEPELLGNDALEVDLYALRDKLSGTVEAGVVEAGVVEAGVGHGHLAVDR